MTTPNQVYKNVISSRDDPEVNNTYMDDRVVALELMLSGGSGYIPITTTPNSLIKYSDYSGEQFNTAILTTTTVIADDGLDLATIDNPSNTLNIGTTASVIDFHNTPVINFSAVGPGVSYTAVAPINPINANAIVIDNTLSQIKLQFADATRPGILSITDQSIAGTKTFTQVNTPILDSPLSVLSLGATATKILFAKTPIESFMDYSQNIEIGQNALALIRGQQTNSIAIGANTLSIATNAASQNIALGNFSLNKIVDGINNTALGHQALRNNNASNSTGIGFWALRASTAEGNTAIGSLALYQNTIGALNTALGTTTLAANTTGNGCSGVGYNALASNTTGNNNTATGAQCLDSNTTGLANSAYGTNASSENVIGNRNCSFGVSTLFNSLSDDNTAFGYSCMANVSTGVSNIGIGSGAGSAITTTSNNICIANIGVVSDSGVIRLGTAGTHLKNFQAGIRGITPDLSDSLPVRITSTGQMTSGAITLSGDVNGTTSATVVNNVGGKNEVQIANTVNDVAAATNVNVANAIVRRSAGGNISVSDLDGVNLSATANLNLPATASGSIGVINQGGSRCIHSIGTNCFFAGLLAGNPASSSGARTTGVGVSAMTTALGGADCSAFGYQSLTLNTGAQNSGFGSLSLSANSTGTGNIAMGYSAGSAITTSSNNICIGNTGVLADSGVIRLGTAATHLKNFQAGIRGITGDATDSIPVYITSTGQLTSVSNSKASGTIYGPISSQALTTATWTALTGIVNNSALSNFDRPADNRLRYTGTTTVNVMFTVNLTIQANSTTNLFVGITKNGSTPPTFTQGGIATTSGVNYNFAPSAVFSMATNDYISVYVFSTTATATTISGASCIMSAFT